MGVGFQTLSHTLLLSSLQVIMSHALQRHDPTIMMEVNLFLRVTGNYHASSLQKYIQRLLGGACWFFFFFFTLHKCCTAKIEDNSSTFDLKSCLKKQNQVQDDKHIYDINNDFKSHCRIYIQLEGTSVMVTGTKEIYLLFPPMNMQNSICFLTLWLQRQSLIRTLTSHSSHLASSVESVHYQGCQKGCRRPKGHLKLTSPANYCQCYTACKKYTFYIIIW